MKKSLVLSLLVAMLASCEGGIIMHGQVYDSKTKLPIDSVWVTITADGKSIGAHAYTDSTGYFSVSNGVGGWYEGHKVGITLFKDGYDLATAPDDSAKLEHIEMKRKPRIRVN